MNSKSIKEWRQEDRPREKMLARGVAALTDAELLAVLLRTGSDSASAVDLARELLEGACNSMQDLSNYSLEKMTRQRGVGLAKATTLLAAFEAGRRSMTPGRDSDRTIYNARSAMDLMAPLINHLNHEECWGIFLNRANKVIVKERLSSGGISSTTFDVRMVVKRRTASAQHRYAEVVLDRQRADDEDDRHAGDVAHVEALHAHEREEEVE